MKKITAILLALIMLFALAAPVFADDDELVTTYVTVVGCRYDEANDYYELAISFRRAHYAVYDNMYRWYYTTANVGWNLDTTRVAFDSDGSKRGEAALNSILNKEPIPLGTVIEMTWSGLVFEEYPPSLIGIVSFTFTGQYTDYSYDDIISELSNMNEFRDDSVKYPVPDESEVKDCYYRAEYTVLKTTPASAPDYEEYGIYTPSMILIRKVGSGQYTDIISIGVDANEMCVTRDNDAEAKGIYETYISNHAVPQGTVVEVVWSGATLESYPGLLEDVVEIKFTSKTSEYTAEELAKEEYDYEHAFDEPIVEGSENDVNAADSNPKTGTSHVFAGVALAGILAWVAAVTATKSK